MHINILFCFHCAFFFFFACVIPLEIRNFWVNYLKIRIIRRNTSKDIWNWWSSSLPLIPFFKSYFLKCIRLSFSLFFSHYFYYWYPNYFDFIFIELCHGEIQLSPNSPSPPANQPNKSKPEEKEERIATNQPHRQKAERQPSVSFWSIFLCRVIQCPITHDFKP